MSMASSLNRPINWQWIAVASVAGIIAVVIIMGRTLTGESDKTIQTVTNANRKIHGRAAVGTWVIPGSQGNYTFESNGTAYLTDPYGGLVNLTWKIDGEWGILAPVENPTDIAYFNLSDDDHLRLYAPTDLKNPVNIFTRYKQ